MNADFVGAASSCYVILESDLGDRPFFTPVVACLLLVFYIFPMRLPSHPFSSSYAIRRMHLATAIISICLFVSAQHINASILVCGSLYPACHVRFPPRMLVVVLFGDIACVQHIIAIFDSRLNPEPMAFAPRQLVAYSWSPIIELHVCTWTNYLESACISTSADSHHTDYSYSAPNCANVYIDAPLCVL